MLKSDVGTGRAGAQGGRQSGLWSRLFGMAEDMMTRKDPDDQESGGELVPQEALEAIRQIGIRARNLVDQSLSGAYRSVFKGTGIEFAGVREYVPGDDVRAIDWNVTARTDRPSVKIFEEERELNIVLAADLSRSNRFGSSLQLRREIIAEICGVLGLAATGNKDRVGLMLFTDEVEHYIRPARGRNHVMRLIRDLMVKRAQGYQTDLNNAMRHLGNILKRKTTIFLVSDFWDDIDPTRLRSLAKRHDCVAIRVRDPKEVELPDAGLVQWRDAESSDVVLLDTSHGPTRAAYRARRSQADRELGALLKSSGVDLVDVDMSEGYVLPLIGFFKKRTLRRGHRR